jgi:hypothetical protein
MILQRFSKRYLKTVLFSLNKLGSAMHTVTQNSIGEGGVISMPGKKGSRMPFRLGYF